MLVPLMGMSKDRPGRLRSLRFAMSREPTTAGQVELIQLYCSAEMDFTASKLVTLKQRSAKARQVRDAVDALRIAGAAEHAPEILAAAESLLVDLLAQPSKQAPAAAPPLPIVFVLTIDEQDVVVLQVPPRFGVNDLQDVVFAAFAGAGTQRFTKSGWLAFNATGRRHVEGKSEWLGLSRSVPLPVLDAIQGCLEHMGLQVRREMGRAIRLDLNPFARLSADGLEILVPAALAGDRRRSVPRGETTPVVRGYVIGR